MHDVSPIPIKTMPVNDLGFFTRTWIKFFEEIRIRCMVWTGRNTTSAVAGTASALPALPSAYLVIKIDGQEYKIPAYK